MINEPIEDSAMGSQRPKVLHADSENYLHYFNESWSKTFGIDVWKRYLNKSWLFKAHYQYELVQLVLR